MIDEINSFSERDHINEILNLDFSNDRYDDIIDNYCNINSKRKDKYEKVVQIGNEKIKIDKYGNIID